MLGLCPALPVAAAEPPLHPQLPPAPAQQPSPARPAAAARPTPYQCLHVVSAGTDCARPRARVVPCSCARAPPDLVSQEKAAPEEDRGGVRSATPARRDAAPALSWSHRGPPRDHLGGGCSASATAATPPAREAAPAHAPPWHGSCPGPGPARGVALCAGHLHFSSPAWPCGCCK